MPMAEGGISEEKDAELVEAFEEQERERIGTANNEECHALLDHLEKTYLHR